MENARQTPEVEGYRRPEPYEDPDIRELHCECHLCPSGCTRFDFRVPTKVVDEFSTEPDRVLFHCPRGHDITLVQIRSTSSVDNAGYTIDRNHPLWRVGAADKGDCATTPDRPGLWLRKEPRSLPDVVRVSANVNVYDGPRLPLAWCPTDDPADYQDVRDDNYWVCEVLPEDLPYDVMVEAIQKTVSAVRKNRQTWQPGSGLASCDVAIAAGDQGR